MITKVNAMTKNKKVLDIRKLLLAVTAIVAVAMIGKGLSVSPIIKANDKTAEKLRDEIANEKSRIEEIDATYKMAGTDEFIEKIARENLGMIKANEIVFIDIAGQ